MEITPTFQGEALAGTSTTTRSSGLFTVPPLRRLNMRPTSTVRRASAVLPSCASATRRKVYTPLRFVCCVPQRYAMRPVSQSPRFPRAPVSGFHFTLPVTHGSSGMALRPVLMVCHSVGFSPRSYSIRQSLKFLPCAFPNSGIRARINALGLGWLIDAASPFCATSG